METKGERTKRRLLTISLELFEERGYRATTMRDIAARAECSVGLVYRYYSSKEALVMAFYERLMRTLEEQVEFPPESPISERFGALVRKKIGMLEPHRKTLEALFASLMSPSHALGVFGVESRGIRARQVALLEELVATAPDAPGEARLPQLSRAMYLLYLMLLLFWMQDQSGGELSGEMLGWVEEALSAMPLSLLLSLPFVRERLERLDGMLEAWYQLSPQPKQESDSDD